MTNRYADLLAAMPLGSFYDATGKVLPWRGTSPYQLLLGPVPANRTFQVVVNTVVVGTVTSDGTGQATINVVLAQGRNDIVLVDLVNGATFPAWITTRASATIQAAHADAFDTIETNLDDIQAALSISTVNARLIETYALRVRQPAPMGWLFGSYKQLLISLRQAYRIYGSKVAGLWAAAAGFTSSVPLVVPASWKPSWVLAGQLLESDFLTFSRRLMAPTPPPLQPQLIWPTLNARVSDYVHAAFGGVGVVFPPPYTSPPVPQGLTVTFSLGWNGGSVVVVGTDPLGNALSETFTPVGVQPLAAAEVVYGMDDFAVVSSATKGAGSGGTASIGVSEGAFVDVTLNPLIGPQGITLSYVASPDRLRLSTGLGAGPLVAIGADDFPPPAVAGGMPAATTFTLFGPPVVADWFALAQIAPGGSFNIPDGGFASWLTLEVDGLGPVQIDLSSGTHTPTLSLAAVVLAINTSIVTYPQYAAYGSVASAAASGVNNFSSVLRLTGLVAGAPHPDAIPPVLGGSVRIYPGGADASLAVTGSPRFSTSPGLTGSVGPRSVVLPVPFGARLYSGLDPLVLHPAVTDMTGATSAGFVQPAHPTALEVYFDAAWNGGDVVVQGTAYGGGADGARFVGAAESVTFTAPGSSAVVASGTAGVIDGPRLVGVTGADSFAGVSAGMFYRLASGEGAYVKYVHPGNLLELLTDISVVGGTHTWSVHRDAVVRGDLAFQTVTGLTNLTPVGAPPGPGPTPSGSVTLLVVDAATRGYGIRLGRGMRTNGTVGPTAGTLVALGTPVLAHLTLPLGAGFAVEYSDFGGSVLVYGSGSGNNGLHSIVGLTMLGDGTTGLASGEVLLRWGGAPGGSFTSESVNWRLYSPGELVTVVEAVLGGGTPHLGLYPPGTQLGWASGAQVEVADGMPFTAYGLDSTDSVDVLVDRTFLPAATTSDNVTVEGSQIPDGVRARNQVPATDVYLPPGYTTPVRLELFGSGVADADNASVGNGDQTLDLAVPRATVAGIRGLFVRADFYVQQAVSLAAVPFRVDFSFDGLNFVAGAVTMVSGTYQDATGPGTLDPTLVSGRIMVPVDAEVMFVRLRQVGTAVPGPVQAVVVENVVVVGELQGSAYLGEGTLPADEQRQNFGSTLWVWSPEALNTQEQSYLGLPAPPGGVPTAPGQIDWMVNAHGYWERYDVSEYNPEPSVALNVAAGPAQNLVGAYLDVDWFMATLTNMSVVVGTPPRMTAVVPVAVSAVTQTDLVFTAPSNAALSVVSAHDGDVFGPVGAVGAAVPQASLSAPSGSNQTLTDVGANFVAGAVGAVLVVSGAEEPTNNGQFTVLSRTTTSVTYANANGAAEPSFAGVYRLYAVYPEAPFGGGDGGSEVLLETAVGASVSVPVPSSPTVTGGTLPWRFTGPSGLQVASLAAGDPAGQTWFQPTSTYSVQYQRLTRAEPVGFDLSAGFAGSTDYQSYVWLVDCACYRRTEVAAETLKTTQELTFLANYQATLNVVSNMDATVSALVADNGVVATQVAAANWSYVDGTTVQLNPSVFDPGVVYSLTYVGLVPAYPDVAGLVIEHRSSNVSLGAVTSQVYRRVSIGQPVAAGATGDRYHQLRATFTGIVDVRDVVLAGLGLRGAHLFPPAAYAPGVVLP